MQRARKDQDAKVQAKEKRRRKGKTNDVASDPPISPPLLQNRLNRPHNTLQQLTQPLTRRISRSTALIFKWYTTETKLNPQQQADTTCLAARMVGKMLMCGSRGTGHGEGVCEERNRIDNDLRVRQEGVFGCGGNDGGVGLAG